MASLPLFPLGTVLLPGARLPLQLFEPRYLERLGAVADPVEAPTSQVAYRVVERMVLDPSDRQRVLDGADPATRLRTVLALLRREAAIIGRFGALPTAPPMGGAGLN